MDPREIGAALSVDADLHGGDVALALDVAEMSEVAKAKSRENIRKLSDEMRATGRPIRDDERAAL